MRGRLPQKVESIGAAIGVIDPPAYLDLTDDQRQVWGRIQPLLSGNGVCTELDIDAIADYCRDYVWALSLRKRITAEGEVTEITNARGNKSAIRSQLVTTLKDVQKRIDDFRDNYGLNAAARGKVRKSSDAVDEDQEFFKGA